MTAIADPFGDSKFWRQLGKKFRAISEAGRELSAERLILTRPDSDDVEEQTPPDSPFWNLIGEPAETRAQFQTLALRGGDALLRNDVIDGVSVWLETLKKEKLNYSGPELQDAGSACVQGSSIVWVERLSGLCTASAMLCSAMEFHVLASERIARANAQNHKEPEVSRTVSVPSYVAPLPPNEAAIAPRETESSGTDQRRSVIDPLLQHRGWSVNDWANHAKLSHATAMDYLDGKTNPYRSTRKKLADALGLAVEHLPK